MDNNNVKLELIIPSYNRADILNDTLKAVRLLYPDLKVCIGLQGEKPSDEMWKALHSDNNIRIEMLPMPSTTRTLNHCIKTSEADIILILDDDAVPCVGWAESHVAAFCSDPGLVYTSGREVRSRKGRSAFLEETSIFVEGIFGLFLKNDKKVNGRIVGWINALGLMFGNFNQPGTCVINSPRGCNLGLRKDSFIALDGFDEKFRGNAWGFEADFGLRAAHEHKFGRYVGDAVVIHHEVAGGGSRAGSKSQWYSDYVYNHKVLIKNIGLAGWIGSVPRLLKKFISLFLS